MLTDQDLDKYRAEYPQGIIHLVGKDGKWEVVFRAPSRPEYKMFRANCHNTARVADANETIAIQTVVYPPTKDAFHALLDKFPGIPEVLAADEDFRDLVGLSVEQGAK